MKKLVLLSLLAGFLLVGFSCTPSWNKHKENWGPTKAKKGKRGHNHAAW